MKFFICIALLVAVALAEENASQKAKDNAGVKESKNVKRSYGHLQGGYGSSYGAGGYGGSSYAGSSNGGSSYASSGYEDVSRYLRPPYVSPSSSYVAASPAPAYIAASPAPSLSSAPIVAAGPNVGIGSGYAAGGAGYSDATNGGNSNPGYASGAVVGSGRSYGPNEGILRQVTYHRDVLLPVNIPQPIPVENKVPYPVHVPVQIPVERPVPYPVVKLVPVPVERPFPVPVQKEVPSAIKFLVRIPVPKSYPVPNPVPVAHPLYHERPQLVIVKPAPHVHHHGTPVHLEPASQLYHLAGAIQSEGSNGNSGYVSGGYGSQSSDSLPVSRPAVYNSAAPAY